MFGDREFIHADLVAFGQIGIKIILACPTAGRRDLAVGCGRRTQGEFNNFFIQDGQYAWQAETHRTGLMIGLSTEPGGAATKYFGLRQHLCVHF